MAYSKYIEHKAQAGERWDDLAYKYYGNCFQVAEIIDANPQIGISPFLPEGEIIIIPILEKTTQTKTTNESLPIWQQLK